MDSHEDTLITGGLAEGKGRIISIDKYVVLREYQLACLISDPYYSEELNLKDTLFSELPELFEGSRVVTASCVFPFCVGGGKLSVGISTVLGMCCYLRPLRASGLASFRHSKGFGHLHEF